MVVRLKWWIQRNPFSNLFLFIKSSQWLSNEGKYMIKDVVKSQCIKDTKSIFIRNKLNDLFYIMIQKKEKKKKKKEKNNFF